MVTSILCVTGIQLQAHQTPEQSVDMLKSKSVKAFF